MAKFRVSAFRGDTIRLLVACTRPDEDGVSQPIDVTGATAWFTAKRSITDADDATTTIQKTSGAGIEVIDSDDDNELLVTLDPEDTDSLTAKTTYVCDLQLEENTGIITTVAFGKLIVLLEATRAS